MQSQGVADVDRQNLQRPLQRERGVVGGSEMAMAMVETCPCLIGLGKKASKKLLKSLVGG
jgi:hypothetical protein